MQRIAGFDGIRGLSVIAVVFTHLHVYVALNEAGFLSSNVIPMIHGATGVQAFFILSGFLITRLLSEEFEETGKVSIKNFYVRRTLRIFPIYFLFLFILLFMSIFLQTDLNRTSLIYSFLYVYNFIPKEDYSSLVGHTWSLAVEEHFYLLWPMVFIILFHKTPQRLLMLLIVAIAGSHILLEVLGSSASLSANYFVNRWTMVAGGNIAVGCLAALLVTTAHQRFREVLGSRLLLYLGIALYASSLAPEMPHEHLRPFGIGLFIVWIYLNQSSRLTQFLEIKGLAYLGMISYGIYMYQGLFLSTGPNRFPGQEWPPNPFIGLILLCIVAPLSFHYIERPFMRLKSKFSVNQTKTQNSLGQTESDVERTLLLTR